MIYSKLFRANTVEFFIKDNTEEMEPKYELEQKVVDAIYRLPPMPSNVESIMKISSSNYNNEELISLIKNDPGLCTNLLHLANSFCSCPEGHIDTVEDAIENVGTGPLAQLIGVLYARDTIEKEFMSITHINEYFEHSRNIARVCCILAENCGLDEHQRQMYSVAGLIHDIGRLVIMIARKNTSSHLIGTPAEEMASIVNDEKKALGMEHCEVGMRLCKRWNFSCVLQSGILRHHSPMIGNDFNFPGAVIFVAHFITESDLTGEIICNMLPEELLYNLKLCQDDFKKVRDIYNTQA